jgi:hypothetical protein
MPLRRVRREHWCVFTPPITTRSGDALASLANLSDKLSLAMPTFGAKADIGLTPRNVRF